MLKNLFSSFRVPTQHFPECFPVIVFPRNQRQETKYKGNKFWQIQPVTLPFPCTVQTLAFPHNYFLNYFLFFLHKPRPDTSPQPQTKASAWFSILKFVSSSLCYQTFSHSRGVEWRAGMSYHQASERSLDHTCGQTVFIVLFYYNSLLEGWELKETRHTVHATLQFKWVYKNNAALTHGAFLGSGTWIYLCRYIIQFFTRSLTNLIKRSVAKSWPMQYLYTIDHDCKCYFFFFGVCVLTELTDAPAFFSVRSTSCAATKVFFFLHHANDTTEDLLLGLPDNLSFSRLLVCTCL